MKYISISNMLLLGAKSWPIQYGMVALDSFESYYQDHIHISMWKCVIFIWRKADKERRWKKSFFAMNTFTMSMRDDSFYVCSNGTLSLRHFSLIWLDTFGICMRISMSLALLASLSLCVCLCVSMYFYIFLCNPYNEPPGTNFIQAMGERDLFYIIIQSTLPPSSSHAYIIICGWRVGFRADNVKKCI